MRPAPLPTTREPSNWAPRNPAAYNNRGNARAENNDRDGAIADYTRAIELKPDYARAYYNRAVAKQEKGDATGAKADFKLPRNSIRN